MHISLIGDTKLFPGVSEGDMAGVTGMDPITMEKKIQLGHRTC